MEQDTSILSAATEQEPQVKEDAPETSFDDPSYLYNTLVTFLNKKSVETLADDICKKYAQLLQVREAALFLEEQSVYRIRGSYGIHHRRITSIALAQRSPLVLKLKELKKILVFKKQGDFSLEEFHIFYLRKALSRFVLDYVVILRDGQRFLGFVILGKSVSSLQPLSPKIMQIVTHLSKQATVTLEQKIFFEQYQEIQLELRGAKQIKNYLLAHVSEGVVMIDYATGKVDYVNIRSKEIFGFGLREGGVSKGYRVMEGKRIEEIIAKLPNHSFSAFLQRYKEAKAVRRVLTKPLFYEHKLTVGGAAYLINSTFIKGGKGARGIDLVVISKTTE